MGLIAALNLGKSCFLFQGFCHEYTNFSFNIFSAQPYIYFSN